MRQTLLALIAVVVVVAATTAVWAAATAQRGGTTAILLGMSPSEVADEATVIACAKQAIDRAVADGATVEMAPIGRPSGMAWKAVDMHLSFDERTNPHTAEERRQSFEALAGRGVMSILKGPRPGGSSDVLSATSSAARALSGADGPLRLVVCGDGHQVGGGVNFYRRLLTPTDRRRLVRALGPSLPDLRGVDVAFGASGLDRKGDPPNAREQRIARWWTEDWRRVTGAKSVRYAVVAQRAP